MWLASWVHRDISAGNILWLKEDGEEGRGILSDLEFAKKPGTDSASSDPKIVSYHILTEIVAKPLFVTGHAVLHGVGNHGTSVIM
jgi:hypothetical protein